MKLSLALLLVVVGASTKRKAEEELPRDEVSSIESVFNEMNLSPMSTEEQYPEFLEPVFAVASDEEFQVLSEDALRRWNQESVPKPILTNVKASSVASTSEPTRNFARRHSK